MSRGVTIIVCCYNAGSRITETIQHIAHQKLPPEFPWEVVLVNNASTDDTLDKAHLAWSKFSGRQNFRIVNEFTPGLSAARQKGISESTYDILIFCDDDNHLDGSYVFNAFHLMSRNPEIGIAGGWVKPKLPFYPGKWIEPNYPALAIGKQGNQNEYVSWVFGAGMVVRKSVFDDLQSRNIKILLSDRKGPSQSSGGDAELCQLARFIGHKVYFSLDLILFHQIDGKRLSKRSFIKSNFQNLHATVHLYLLDKLISNQNLSLQKIKLSMLRVRCWRILNAIPRIVVGRHSFLNFLEIYIGSTLISWILFNNSEINKSFVDIKQNLNNGRT